ncbi:FG-GAP-like repeat-containing protein [Kitasatospora sp. NPDC058965]|uniref:FG-GAP-like repeat-containing protein n=1 Tax=Kitasatospora sp. NPDC058965 TaxID=3346682 RepID=UPI0036827BA1
MHHASSRRRGLLRSRAAALTALTVPLGLAGSLLAAGPAAADTPTVVSYSQAPANHQLYPRDPVANTAVVPIAGQVTQGQPTAMRLDVTQNGQPFSSTTVAVTGTGASFSFTPTITAGLNAYGFSLYAVGSTAVLQNSWTDVVAGDVFLDSGQSNAAAHQRYDTTAVNSSAVDQSPWVRTFGSSTNDPAQSAQDSTWQQAQGDGYQGSGTVGQYAVRMGRRIVDTYGVPVAVLQGGQDGMPISFFQPNTAKHDDTTTNYGRLLDRAERAGVQSRVRGIFWYQGESDNNDATAQTNGFGTLLTAWKQDYPGLQHVYPHQIRNGCLSPSGSFQASYQERDAQRGYSDLPGVTLLSTNGVDRQGGDSCHYYYLGGYQALADHDFATVAHDLYGGSATASTPPAPAGAWFSAADHSRISIGLRNTTDRLNLPCGPAGDFVVNGSTVSVTSVAVQPGLVVLQLSGPATGATGISYLGHDGAGNWITNDNGAGLLAFANLPFGADQPAAMPAAARTCPALRTPVLTAAGDFNGDGKVDLAVLGATNDLRLYPGNADGTLSTGPGQAMWAAGGLWQGFKAIAAGDFNGDGKVDIAGIDAYNDLRLYTNDGQGHLGGGALMWPGGGLWQGFKSLVAGDFNGDGKVDLAGIDAYNDLRVYLGNGDGTLNTSYGGWKMLPGNGNWVNFHGLAAGDFNGDGKADIAGIDAYNDLRLYTGNGDGTLNTSSGGLMWPGGGLWQGFGAIAAGDFNHDGKADIAGIDAYKDLRLYAGSGNGTLNTSSGGMLWGGAGYWGGS